MNTFLDAIVMWFEALFRLIIFGFLCLVSMLLFTLIKIIALFDWTSPEAAKVRRITFLEFCNLCEESADTGVSFFELLKDEES